MGTVIVNLTDQMERLSLRFLGNRNRRQWHRWCGDLQSSLANLRL